MFVVSQATAGWVADYFPHIVISICSFLRSKRRVETGEIDFVVREERLFAGLVYILSFCRLGLSFEFCRPGLSFEFSRLGVSLDFAGVYTLGLANVFIDLCIREQKIGLPCSNRGSKLVQKTESARNIICLP